MEYRYTGAEIPVDVNDLYQKVDNELTGYDHNSDQYDYSPYTDPVIYATPEGKTIVVPDDIKQDIINKHNMNRTSNTNLQKKNEQSNDDNKDNGVNIKKILIIIGIMIVLYLAYKELKNKTK
jgi:hypothetical protein